MLYLHQSVQAEICKPTVGSWSVWSHSALYRQGSVSTDRVEGKIKTIPILFMQMNAMSTKNLSQLFMFQSTYPLIPFHILYPPPCVVRKYILAQIYTSTDIKSVTREVTGCFFCITIKDPALFSVYLVGENKIWRLELLACLPKMCLILLGSVSRSSASDVVVLWSMFL